MEYLEMRGCIARQTQVDAGLVQRLNQLLRKITFDHRDSVCLLSLVGGDLYVDVEGLIQEVQGQRLTHWLTEFIRQENINTLVVIERVRWELNISFAHPSAQHTALAVSRPVAMLSR